MWFQKITELQAKTSNYTEIYWSKSVECRLDAALKTLSIFKDI